MLKTFIIHAILLFSVTGLGAEEIKNIMAIPDLKTMRAMNGIDPGKPLDTNTYELSEAEEAALSTVPGSLEDALDALEEDHDFLLKGDVFTQDVLDVWIEFKRQQIDEINLRPHPYEFHLYFDM